jgi:RNA polymerase sigma factor (sigma-70 family)
MATMTDGELLRAYAIEGSETAFTELVNRYVNLVHSVAGRHLPDHSLAEEVTQSVFVLLARKAKSLAEHPSLAGWLHRTSWQLAARTVRTEQRRRHWETEAGALSPNEPLMPDSAEPSRIVPALDDALQELSETDRNAIVLRYYLRQPLRDVGAALGTSEAAAKMRVRRALDQLRTLLVRRGVLCSPATLAAAMVEQGVTPAPTALATSVAAWAISAGGATAPFPLFVHGLLGIMKGTKLTGLILAAAFVATLSTVTVRLLRPPEPAGTPDSPSQLKASSPGTKQVAGTSFPPRVAAAAAPTPLTPEELEAARQRLRLALAAPIPPNGVTWPDAVVLEAMAAFGDHQEQLFAALRQAVLEPSPAGDRHHLPAGRALRAMGQLSKSLPGLTPFLWEKTGQGEWLIRVAAFSALRQLGFESSDLPALTRLLGDSTHENASPALRAALPRAIDDVFRKSPEASAAYLPSLVEVFEGASDSFTRFAAAAALLGTPEGSDSRVIETLRNGLREGLNVSITDRRTINVNLAIERAGAAGDAAKPLVPDLLEVARTSGEVHQRNAAWLAIGQIQPELRAEIPELDQAITRDAETRQVREAVSQGFGTQDELMRALRDPATALKAATTLGETGVHSPEVIPAMVAALAGMDEESRDQVVAAIHKLDPQAQIERVPSEVMFDAVIFADSAFEAHPAADRKVEVERLLSDQRMFSSWRTRDEILGVAKRLAALDVSTAQAFAKGIAEKDPALADQARQFIPPLAAP